MKNGICKICLSSLCLTLTLLLSSCNSPISYKEHAAPTTILIWHYYNGVQKQIFDRLVTSFNETVGEKENIFVEAVNQGSVNELAQKALDAMAHKVGAMNAPDAFAAYADTVYKAANQHMVADISPYLSAEEKSEFLDSYLQEGELYDDGRLYIFPIAKATEVLIVNDTDWKRFADATGAPVSDFETWEGIGRLAEAYYRWTDSLTDAENDGKAFFGRDAMANYMLVGSAQLGHQMFCVPGGHVEFTLDQTSMRKLWDAYYVPYINGYFASFGRFRSDDVKTGDLIAQVGSTSSAAFFPSEVTLADGSTYPIESEVYPLPGFEGAIPVAIQQGAGMAVAKSNPKTEEACVTFLKWFTQREQNDVFSSASGYLPVKKRAADDDPLIAYDDEAVNPVVRDVLAVGLEMSKTYAPYIGKPFQGSSEARNILESSLQEKAAQDRANVVASMADGKTREDAVAQMNTKENFLAWFSTLHRQLEQALGLRPKENSPRFMVK